MSVDDAALPALRDLDTDTCCPEEAELVPCSACYEKHHREKAAAESAQQQQVALFLAPAPASEQPLLSDLTASATSLLRVPPPEIPHGHAAAAPEDIRHHQAHARQLPAPNPPDPLPTAEEAGSTPSKQPQVEAVKAGAEGGERAQRAARDAATATAPPSAPSAASPAPYGGGVGGGGADASFVPPSPYAEPQPHAGSSAPLASVAVGSHANAGDGTQSVYGTAPSDVSQTAQYYGAHASLYGHPHPRSPSFYDQHGALAQQQAQAQADLYSSMYSAQAGYMMPQPATVYTGAPMTVAGPNGTFVYFPNTAPPMLSAPQQPHVTHVQQSQLPPPGFLNFFTAQQPQHSTQQPMPVHVSHQQPPPAPQQQQQQQVSMQQPVAYVNGVPVYLTTAPPSSSDASEQSSYPSYAPHSSHHLRAPSADTSPMPSPPASIASTASSPSSPLSHRSSDSSDKAVLTYKTEICRSFQYSGACEYGASCQFAHGLEQLRTREVDVRFKTERCKNFHAFGPSQCFYGPRCKYLHDDYRVRVGPHEFWLISPRENMVRVEKVDPSNAPRLSQLTQLIAEQTGAATQAAQELAHSMGAMLQQQQQSDDGGVDAACEQLQEMRVHEGQQQPGCASTPLAARPDAAARFLKAIVSPYHGGLGGSMSMSAPINVQAMQVQPSSGHHYRGLKNSFGHGGGSACSPPSSYHSSPPPGHPHQQPGALYSSNGSAPAATAAAFPPTRLPSPFGRRSGPPPHPHHHSSHGYASGSPLSVLSNLLTPQALQLLSLNAGSAALGRLCAEEPKKRRRARKKRRAPARAAFKAGDDSTSGELVDQEAAEAEQPSDEDDRDEADDDQRARGDRGAAQPETAVTARQL